MKFSLALLVTLFTLALAGTAAAATRHATPTGAGDCSAGSPCSLVTAIDGAANGDEIVVHPGEHTVATILDDYGKRLDIHGAAGQPRPRILSSASGAAVWLSHQQSTLAALDVLWTGANGHAILTNGSSVDRLSVHATQGGALRLDNNSGPSISITNSSFYSDVVGGSAVYINAFYVGTPAPLVVTLRNVTILAATTGSAGVEIAPYGHAAANATVTVNATNAIIRGVAYDIIASPSEAGDSATVNLAHSNFATTSAAGAGTVSFTANDVNGNQSAAPLFADAAAGDLRQMAGSPTIDAGVTDAANGTVDVNGSQRTQGAATDIGGYEHTSPPADPPVQDPAAPDTGAQPPMTDTVVPPAGTPRGGPSAQPAPAKCIVPRVKGKTLKAARAALLKAGCKVGKVTRRRSARRVGKVLSQRTAGTKVHLVVGRKP
jgi:hypothetical protein